MNSRKTVQFMINEVKPNLIPNTINSIAFQIIRLIKKKEMH